MQMKAVTTVIRTFPMYTSLCVERCGYFEKTNVSFVGVGSPIQLGQIL